MTTIDVQAAPAAPISALDSDPASDSGEAWVPVCRLADLTPDRGVAALVGRQQVAVFLLSPPAGESASGATDEVYAVDNRDPYSGASVLARGLVGSVGDRPTVASPIYKERFDLRTGACLDGDRSVRAWPVRIVDGCVEVAAARA